MRHPHITLSESPGAGEIGSVESSRRAGRSHVTGTFAHASQCEAFDGMGAGGSETLAIYARCAELRSAKSRTGFALERGSRLAAKNLFAVGRR